MQSVLAISFGVCGDNIVEGIEECDDGANGNDYDQCSDACTNTFCGDGIIQDDPSNGDGFLERCEFTLDDPFNGYSCEDFGLYGDNLSCNPPGTEQACLFDTSDCYENSEEERYCILEDSYYSPDQINWALVLDTYTGGISTNMFSYVSPLSSPNDQNPTFDAQFRYVGTVAIDCQDKIFRLFGFSTPNFLRNMFTNPDSRWQVKGIMELANYVDCDSAEKESAIRYLDNTPVYEYVIPSGVDPQGRYYQMTGACISTTF